MSPGRALEKPHYDKQSGNKDHFLFHALLEVDPYARLVQRRIHKVMSHAGRRPASPRNQYLKGERRYPDLSSRLTAVSAKTTPNRATTEERSAERGKGSRSDPTDDGSKPRKAINQAGKSAMIPRSQCCRGPQLETLRLAYGTTAAVVTNPRTPRTIESLIIPCLWHEAVGLENRIDLSPVYEYANLLSSNVSESVAPLLSLRKCLPREVGKERIGGDAYSESRLTMRPCQLSKRFRFEF
jgi:hypothetical protein